MRVLILACKIKVSLEKGFSQAIILYIASHSSVFILSHAIHRIGLLEYQDWPAKGKDLAVRD